MGHVAKMGEMRYPYKMLVKIIPREETTCKTYPWMGG